MITVLGVGEGSASRPGRSLPPGKIRYPLNRRLGGPQMRKNSPPPVFDPRNRPARSQSLYRLRYPAHIQPYTRKNNQKNTKAYDKRKNHKSSKRDVKFCPYMVSCTGPCLFILLLLHISKYNFVFNICGSVHHA